MQYSGIPSQSGVAFPHLTNLRSGTCGSSRDYFSLVWTSQWWVQLCAGVSLDSSVKRPAPKVGNLSVRGPSASLEAYCVWEPGELVTPTTTAEAHSILDDSWLGQNCTEVYIFVFTFWHSAHSDVFHQSHSTLPLDLAELQFYTKTSMYYYIGINIISSAWIEHQEILLMSCRSGGVQDVHCGSVWCGTLRLGLAPGEGWHRHPG